MAESLAVVFNKSTYDVLSASAEAYAFIGKRLYHTFVQLTAPEDLDVFLQQAAACTGEEFPLRLLAEDGTQQLFIASVAPSANENAAVVSFAPAKQLLDTVNDLRRALTAKNTVLSLYGDEFFDYDAATDHLRVYKVGRYEQVIVNVTLDAFLNRLQSTASPENQDKVQQFASDFRSKRAMFTLNASGHLLNPDKEATNTLIKAVSLFDHGVYTGATGSIHFGARRSVTDQPMRERDSLTGVLPKAGITSAAITIIDAQKVQDTTLAIIDVDYFKQVNDTFGHLSGDAVLERIASIIEEEVGSSGLVGRIGGDEFMVLFFRMGDMENNRELLRSIKNRVSAAFPPGNPERPAVSLSIGCAAYPKDADCYEDLFRLADFAMYRAKQNGRNRYVIFDKAKHGSLEDILHSPKNARRYNNRGDMSAGDIVCTMMSRVFHGEAGPVDALLEDAAMNLGFQRVMLYAGDPWQTVCMAGEKRPDDATLRETIGYLDDPALEGMYSDHGVLVCNDIDRFESRSPLLHARLKKQGVLSFIHIRGTDADGVRFLLSIESVSKRITWNESYVPYYALFQQMLHQYHLIP